MDVLLLLLVLFFWVDLLSASLILGLWPQEQISKMLEASYLGPFPWSTGTFACDLASGKATDGKWGYRIWHQPTTCQLLSCIPSYVKPLVRRMPACRNSHAWSHSAQQSLISQNQLTLYYTLPRYLDPSRSECFQVWGLCGLHRTCWGNWLRKLSSTCKWQLLFLQARRS